MKLYGAFLLLAGGDITLYGGTRSSGDEAARRMGLVGRLANRVLEEGQ